MAWPTPTRRNLQHGTGIRPLNHLLDTTDDFLRECFDLRLKRRQAFRRSVPLAKYWQCLQEHLGEEHTFAILGLEGMHYHWTSADQRTFDPARGFMDGVDATHLSGLLHDGEGEGGEASSGGGYTDGVG
jgi:hypothetical protein